jgi:deoxyinosine 3'endonuclease (endonuclease V)
MVRLAAPYIPGFLGFRESEFLCTLGKALKLLRKFIVEIQFIVPDPYTVQYSTLNADQLNQ